MDQPFIASMFADAYREWAWDEGRDEFPHEYFDEAYPTEVFLKHAAGAMLHNQKPVHANLKCVDSLRKVLNGEPYKMAEDCVVAAQKAAWTIVVRVPVRSVNVIPDRSSGSLAARTRCSARSHPRRCMCSRRGALRRNRRIVSAPNCS
ncbi:hypothetical protein BCEP27_10643 [Burkholderia cepacia]